MADVATVFGGSGFIGRYVVKRLAAAGHRVRVATGMVRASRAPFVLARLIRIWKIQVVIEERPSNEGRPPRTASQVSCTTSSADASVDTNARAVRCSAA